VDNLPNSVEKMRVLWKTFSLLPEFPQSDSVNMGGGTQTRPYMEITPDSYGNDEIPSPKRIAINTKIIPKK
jgi:hypothetical protein